MFTGVYFKDKDFTLFSFFQCDSHYSCVMVNVFLSARLMYTTKRRDETAKWEFESDHCIFLTTLG